MNNSSGSKKRTDDKYHENGYSEFRDEFQKVAMSATNQWRIRIMGIFFANGSSLPYLFGLMNWIDCRIRIISESPKRFGANLVDEVSP